MNVVRRPALVLAASTSALIAIVGASVSFPAPPLRRSGWTGWINTHTPVDLAIALTSRTAAAIALYLLATTLLGVVVRRRSLGQFRNVVDRLTIAPVRLLLDRCFGFGMSVSVLAFPVAADVPIDPPVLERVDRAERAGPLPPLLTRVTTTDQTAAPTLRRVMPAESSVSRSTPPRSDTTLPATVPATSMSHAPTTPAAVPAAAPPPVQRPATPQPPVTGSTWTVRPGDHLWSIAEHVVAQRSESNVTEDDIAAYWHRLVDSNRSRLPWPHDPDVIHPGLIVTLPDLT